MFQDGSFLYTLIFVSHLLTQYINKMRDIRKLPSISKERKSKRFTPIKLDRL